MKFIGIDPGAGGGIAWNSTADGIGAEAMPKTEREIFELLNAHAQQFRSQEPSVVMIERVHTSPQMGVVSAGSFMKNYGFLRGVLTALQIPFVDVTPQAWQKTMGVVYPAKSSGFGVDTGNKGRDKNIPKALAQQLFPKIKVTHSIADALLIAAACAKHDWRGIA